MRAFSVTLVLLLPCVTVRSQTNAVEMQAVDAWMHHHARYERNDAYSVTLIDLNEDGKREAIVYVVGSSVCGSGGCSLLVLTPSARGYRLVTTTTVTHLPIYALKARTNGWRDLSVLVAGGGILPGHYVRLRFNGRKYPSNPTIAPAIAMRGKPDGILLLDSNSLKLPLLSTGQ